MLGSLRFVLKQEWVIQLAKAKRSDLSREYVSDFDGREERRRGEENLRNSRRMRNKLVSFHEGIPNSSNIGKLLRRSVLRNDWTSIGFIEGEWAWELTWRIFLLLRSGHIASKHVRSTARNKFERVRVQSSPRPMQHPLFWFRPPSEYPIPRSTIDYQTLSHRNHQRKSLPTTPLYSNPKSSSSISNWVRFEKARVRFPSFEAEWVRQNLKAYTLHNRKILNSNLDPILVSQPLELEYCE